MILYDYTDEAHEFDVDLDDKNITIAILQVISGDEVLEVTYKDGTTLTFDADTNYRFHDYLDATYILVLNGDWMADREKFLARENSYDDWWAK